MRGKTISIIFLALILLSLLIGCNPPSAQPATGNELVQLGSEPSTLDPHLVIDSESAAYVVEIFGGLVTLDTDFKVMPDLAEKWDISQDKNTYTFTLRDNAKFHNGKAVTANDVKWSLERATDPATQSPAVDTYLGDIVGVKEKLSGKSTEISGVKVINDRVIEITIDAPKTYFLAKLTYPTAFVIDRENVQSSQDWLEKPNGTGPFKLKEYTLGKRLILDKFPEYHLGAAKLDRVRFILSGGTPMVMYENDEIQISGVALDDIPRVSDPGSPLNKEVHITPEGFDTAYLGMNVARPPFDDEKVRQALTYAIDKEQIATELLSNMVKPAYTILPPGFPGFSADLQGLTYDVEKAKQLLADSKYGADPTKFPSITLTVSGELGTPIGTDLEAIIAVWRENLGIEVEVQQVEFSTFLKDLYAKRFQLSSAAWRADYPDPQNFLDLLFHSGSFNNETGYNNSEVDRLLEAARAESDEKARFELYHQAEQIILNDAPWIPLWHSGQGYVLIKPEVKDYYLLPLVVPALRFVYLQK